MEVPGRPPPGTIDIHTHLFPERLARAVRRALTGLYGWRFPMEDDPDRFAAGLIEAGVERFCILPYAHKPGMARALNAWVCEAAAALPGAIPFACVHQDDDVRAVLDDAFAAGAKGVKLHHQVQAVAPDDRALDPVYETLLAQDIPLLAHAGRGPTDNGFVGAEGAARALARFPDLRVCIAHMGAPEIDAFLALTERYPSVFLDTSGLGDLSLAPWVTEERAGRIIFGSDAPNIPESYGAAIRRITSLGLGPAAERAIFRDNARAFLGLATQASSG